MEKRNVCFLVKMKCLVLNSLSSCHFEMFAHFFSAKEVDLLELLAHVTQTNQCGEKASFLKQRVFLAVVP